MSKFWTTGDDDNSSSDASSNEIQTYSRYGNKLDETDPSAALGDDYLSENPNEAWQKIEDSQIFRDPLQSTTTAKPPDCTRIVCISDTHGRHRQVHLPAGDILIHGGDFTNSGEVGSIKDLSKYFEESGFQEIVCIAGNHDMTLDPDYYAQKWTRFHRKQFDCREAKASLQHCVYLNDSSYTTKQGNIEFYGSPWSPEFFGWAFNAIRGGPIRNIWEQIPSSTDVLITHGPPLGRGDLTACNGYAGCYDLLLAVQKRIQPRLHVFGHIHEAAGTSFDGQTLFVNASSLDIKYQPVNHPIVIDIPHDVSQPARVVPPNCQVNANELAEWCIENGYKTIGDLLLHSDEIPSGNDLLQHEEAYDILVEHLFTRGFREAHRELPIMLSSLHAQSFPKT